MQNLSIKEFKNYCLDVSANKYIFLTDNQQLGMQDKTCDLELEFKQMKINFNPNSIYLKSDHSSMSIKRIKYIQVDEKSVLGDVFTIVCGDNSKDKSYTIIAQ